MADTSSGKQMTDQYWLTVNGGIWVSADYRDYTRSPGNPYVWMLPKCPTIELLMNFFIPVTW